MSRKVPWSLAVGMILSVAFFAYAWTGDHQFVTPILLGGYLAEALNRVVRLPVWINSMLFFVFNGVLWALLVFLSWVALEKLLVRKRGSAT